MSDSNFENFDVWYDKLDKDDSEPFVFAIEDRESSNERWVLKSLSEEDAKRVADYIYEKLNK